MLVAVWPDAPTLQRLSTLEVDHSDDLRLVEPEQWHITLRFLGDVDEDLVPELVERLEVATSHVKAPVRCEIGPSTAWFSGERVLQLPVAGLDPVAAAVQSATIPLAHRPSRDEPLFSGHLTIARSKALRLSASSREGLADIPFTAAFEVDHFDLVASQPTPHGHRYTTLARVSLPS
jgi:RNA 2',3'-cyclic 3'-phosphodiesterase